MPVAILCAVTKWAWPGLGEGGHVVGVVLCRLMANGPPVLWGDSAGGPTIVVCIAPPPPPGTDHTRAHQLCLSTKEVRMGWTQLQLHSWNLTMFDRVVTMLSIQSALYTGGGRWR